MSLWQLPQRPIKVCCIQDADEARLAMRYGATMLGLVSKMPSGWGPIPEAQIAEIVAVIPPGVISVLLTSAQDVDTIVRQQRQCRANALQLVDGLEAGGHASLRAELPGVSLLQAVHVLDDGAVETARTLAPHVDGLILDTGNPGGDEKVLGGTGLTHDWSISARIVEAVPHTPVFLAGGLKAHNIAAAMAQVNPYGIDLCTGVRTDGVLIEAKLEAFMTAARSA